METPQGETFFFPIQQLTRYRKHLIKAEICESFVPCFIQFEFSHNQHLPITLLMQNYRRHELLFLCLKIGCNTRIVVNTKYFENCEKYFVSADVLLLWASSVRLFLPFGVSKNGGFLRICTIGLNYSFSKYVCVFDFIFWRGSLVHNKTP